MEKVTEALQNDQKFTQVVNAIIYKRIGILSEEVMALLLLGKNIVASILNDGSSRHQDKRAQVEDSSTKSN